MNFERIDRGSGGAAVDAVGDAEADENDVLLRYVERLALVFAESGIPRMPARVYAYVLADDATRYTARDLAEGLRVSPAAISGALKYLVDGQLVHREREPGARVDTYVIEDVDLWPSVFGGRATLIGRWEAVLAEGAEVLGEGRPGGRRLRESQEFFAFLREDVEGMMDRWREYQRRGRQPDGRVVAR
jgi:DNA-binding transcriptional ArsR family regulator